jgi:hypothetical protein
VDLVAELAVDVELLRACVPARDLDPVEVLVPTDVTSARQAVRLRGAVLMHDGKLKAGG